MAAAPPHFYPHANTKIVATVGPACNTEAQLAAMAQAGADVYRINTAHGTLGEHAQTVQRIRNVASQIKRPLGILVDLGGPKIRLGVLPGDAIECAEGAEFRFIRGTVSNTPNDLVITYDKLIDELEPGNQVMLADGTVAMVIVEKTKDFARAKVIQPGIIRSKQGVNLPGAKLSVAALTEIDRQCAAWASVIEADFVGLSFVRSAKDIVELKDLLRPTNPNQHFPRVIAKIEKPEAMANLEAIIQAADGVMVARGDLGVEIDVATLAVAQKRIIAMCNRYQKPVITATQMLDSMQRGKQPTRAEATDVANAILDGTDACMLSGETAVGLNPVAAVEMMNRIALATEPLFRDMPPLPLPAILPDGLKWVTQVTVHNACRIAEQLNAKMLVVATHTGASALAVAKQRTFIPTIGVSDTPSALRQMCLYRGVTPLPEVPTGDVTKLIQTVEAWGRNEKCLATGDRIVVVAAMGWTSTGHNMVLVHELP